MALTKRRWLQQQSLLDVREEGSLLMDLFSVAPAIGFSMRKTRAAYTGACMNVRRDSDNATKDIGFNSEGNLDLIALLLFVGLGSGFVHILYDQSTNANNCTWPTAGSTTQPKIVALGVVQTQNGVPSMKMPGLSALPALSVTLTTPTTYTANGVGAQAASGNNLYVWGSQNGFQSQSLRIDTSNHPHVYVSADVASTSTWSVTSLSGITFVRNSLATVTPYLNNVAGAAMTVSTGNMNLGEFGGNSNVGTDAGWLSEGFYWPTTAIGTTDMTTLHNSQSTYFGTP